MAEPSRPVQDAIIDPAWGQNVHDNVKALNNVQLSKATDAGGNTVIAAAEYAPGITTIAGFHFTAAVTNAFTWTTVMLHADNSVTLHIETTTSGTWANAAVQAVTATAGVRVIAVATSRAARPPCGGWSVTAPGRGGADPDQNLGILILCSIPEVG